MPTLLALANLTRWNCARCVAWVSEEPGWQSALVELQPRFGQSIVPFCCHWRFLEPLTALAAILWIPLLWSLAYLGDYRDLEKRRIVRKTACDARQRALSL